MRLRLAVPSVLPVPALEVLYMVAAPGLAVAAGLAVAPGLAPGEALGVGARFRAQLVPAPPAVAVAPPAVAVAPVPGRHDISPRTSMPTIGPATPPHGMPRAPLEVVAVCTTIRSTPELAMALAPPPEGVGEAPGEAADPAPPLLGGVVVPPVVVPPEVATLVPAAADAMSRTVNSIGLVPPTLSNNVAVPSPLFVIVEPLATVSGHESRPLTFAYVSVRVPPTVPPVPSVSGPIKDAAPGVSVGLVEPSFA